MDMAEINNKKDDKAIEEKALLCLKEYIVDSNVISQYIPENDKEPFWDGHLYLYNNPCKSKDYFIGRVPAQVKGTEVKKFTIQKYKFSIDMVDLKAYLHEPTIYIVCQEKENSKERELFYRCLLPETVKHIINGHPKQKSVKVLMHPIPKDLKEFEQTVIIFHENSKKQISYADAKPFTMDDVRMRGIKDFSLVAPIQKMDHIQLLKYLSTHENYIYARLHKELDVEIPISNGPVIFTFKQDVNQKISVGGETFYNSYSNEIKNGRLIISIGNILTINLPMDSDDTKKTEIKLSSTPTILDEAIKEVQFTLAMATTGKFAIGNTEISVRINDIDSLEGLKQQLNKWLNIQKLLKKLHVTKPFDLSKLTEKQERLLNVLIETIIYNKPIRLENQNNSILLAEIGNVNLLLWCAVSKDNMCMFGDFFDHTIRLFNETNKGKKIEACCYSYLRNDKLWGNCDNIPFDDIIPSYVAISDKNNYIYETANFDVLSIIKEADYLENINKERSHILLGIAETLNNWLYGNEPYKNRKHIHLINKLQIIKRKRDLTEEENNCLLSLTKDKNVDLLLKAGCWLLLKNKENFDLVFHELKQEEQNQLKEFPIWRFAN